MHICAGQTPLQVDRGGDAWRGTLPGREIRRSVKRNVFNGPARVKLGSFLSTDLIHNFTLKVVPGHVQTDACQVMGHYSMAPTLEFGVDVHEDGHHSWAIHWCLQLHNTLNATRINIHLYQAPTLIPILSCCSTRNIPALLSSSEYSMRYFGGNMLPMIRATCAVRTKLNPLFDEQQTQTSTGSWSLRMEGMERNW